MCRFQLLTGFSPEQFLQWCKIVEGVEVQDLIDKSSSEFKPAIQFCYRMALRSFLRHNGYNGLPKTNLQYVPQAWHRGYKRHEIEALLGNLRQKVHRLFVVMAAESGLRSHVLMELRYRHIMEDLDSGTFPVAIRLEPRFYVGKKAAGYTFLGAGSVRLLRECLEEGIPEARPDPKLIPRSYYGVWAAIHRAKRKAGLDAKIQSCHGFRKYFENALDHASIDHERKMIIEGHFAGTRARHYTDRDLDNLRELYRKSYPFIALTPEDCSRDNVNPLDWQKKLAELETKLARQSILETKLVVLEDKLEKLRVSEKNSSSWTEHHTCEA
jgi:integrase